MSVSVIISTSPGRERQARRAHDAYLRETPGAQILLVDDWKAAAGRSCPTAIHPFIHFSSDELEPHPGWFEAARSAIGGRRVPAPTIWAVEPDSFSWQPSSHGGRDWSNWFESEFPTVSRQQLREFGVPPFDQSSPVKFVLRTRYAFTRWPD